MPRVEPEALVNSLSPQLPLLTLLHYDDRMSFGETIFLFFLALIIFGPKKLPEIARTVGKYLNEFKRASNEFKAQIEQEISHLDTAKPQILTPTLSSSSWAGDSHTTEGLAPEGTASRSLTSTGSDSVGAEQATPEPSATLAAPLIEDSNTHENTSASTPLREAAEIEVAPISDGVTDSDKTHSAQESHA
jgi:sec-independent protein translocase protein TatB